MDDLSTLALIGAGGAITISALRAVLKMLHTHREALESEILDIQADGKHFRIDLEEIDKESAKTLKAAAQAVRAAEHKERAAA